MRRVLRREIAGTIGLLTDEHDFTAMRRYRTFTFNDHTTYLQQVESLLRTLAAQGSHTTVALFDPEEYAEFCAHNGLEPDTAASRTRFTAELAATGPTVAYEGSPRRTRPRPRRRSRPQGDLGVRDHAPGPHRQLRVLRRGHRTSVLRPRLPPAHPRPRHREPRRAPTRVQRLRGTRNTRRGAAGGRRRRGHHPPRRGGSPRVHHRPGPGPRHRQRRRTRHAHHRPDTTDRVYGWRLRGEGLQPLTAGEVFDAYCTDVTSGDLVSPESGVDYCVPPDLGGGEEATGHTH